MTKQRRTFHLNSSAKQPAWCLAKATAIPKRPVRFAWSSRPCADGLISLGFKGDRLIFVTLADETYAKK